MSNINETQRKYLRTRLTTIVDAKVREIQAAHVIPNPWAGRDKREYLNSLFTQAGLDLEILNDRYSDTARGVMTPVDMQHRADLETARMACAARIAELNRVSGVAMDEIILGSEAEELRSVVDALNSFTVTAA